MKYKIRAMHNNVSWKPLLLLIALVISSMVVLPACTSGENPSADNMATEQEATLEVTVAIAANEDAGLAAQELIVSVPEGATAYDALEASGWNVVASDGEYGKYVESVAGVANGDTTAWVYSVNGESATVGCESYVLAAGDLIEWSYISW